MFSVYCLIIVTSPPLYQLLTTSPNHNNITIILSSSYLYLIFVSLSTRVASHKRETESLTHSNSPSARLSEIKLFVISFTKLVWPVVGHGALCNYIIYVIMTLKSALSFG